MVKCQACENGHEPSQHKCLMCSKYVHIIDECSKSIGQEEGSGEKRLCNECDKSICCKARRRPAALAAIGPQMSAGFAIHIVLESTVGDRHHGRLGPNSLQLALAHGLMITAEFLLRRGADPNIANASGETALHAVCKFPSRGPSAWYYNEYDLTLMLFECSRDRYKPLRVNARNSKGKTPLELAVANHMPDALEVLLDHGADIAGFVYPAANYVDDELEWIIDVKWRELLGALLCAKRLAKRGYELIWSDALKIMKMFARYGFFEKSDVDLQRSLLDNEGFASRAKSLLVKEDLRLHDLIQLQRPEEVDERVTYQDMFDFVKQDISRFEFDKVGAQEACAVYICEMMSKRFFQSWALYPFWKLIHCRLPLEMCETVLANLKNEDLYHICLATQDQSRDDSKKDVTASVMNCDNNKRPRESEDQMNKTVAIARYTITETKIN
ncbi:unnamed protein product [Trichogramma brassicae]|uniref:Uncharacterized protein n=1 Tax=Trichogramma brassicae TaxID=86971 RepID=A0A6H5IMY5_9HYME|nr:unnamed protein product [Trichogramma brassicae]